MRATAVWLRSAGLPLIAGVGAMVVAAGLIRPVAAALAGSDTASSVLYFERLAAGEPLERFLGATPKPLLTVVDGLLYAVTGDWRPIAWLAILVYGAAIACTVALAMRTAGPVAAAFVGVALVASPGLLQDVANAYAVSWALLAVTVAGLLVMRSPPRYGLAGAALAAGALARQEVLFVIVAAGACVVAARVAPNGLPGRARPRAGLLLGFAAVPLTMLHDLMLTGNPGYTLRVPILGAEGRATGGIEAALAALGAHGLGSPILLVLAGLGTVALVTRGRWAVVVGAWAALGGVLLLVLGLGARDVIVLDRYAVPVELALVVLAGAGIATVSVRGLGASLPRLAGPMLAGVVAVGVIPAVGPLDETAVERIRIEAVAALDLRRILPELAAAVDAEPGMRDAPQGRDPTSRSLTAPVLYVTPRLVSTVAVDLDLGLDHIAPLTALDPDAPPPAGGLALHFARIPRSEASAWAEVDAPTAYPGFRVTVVARVETRVWLVRIDPA